MALPNELGSGGNGFHGEHALKVRDALGSLTGNAQELKTNFNLLLSKLDADAGVTDTNYHAQLQHSSDVSRVMNISFGDGAAFTHGEGGARLKNQLAGIVGGAGNLKNKMNALRVKLDADATVAGTYSGSGATNEVQTVTVTATGGTFTLSFDGDTTEPLNENTTAAKVRTELESLSTIGEGNVTVTGAAGGPWTVTFVGDLGGKNVAQMTASATNLTPGGSTAVVATTTPGVPSRDTTSVNPQSILWELGDGAGGVHGDEARRLKRNLKSITGLNDELVSDFNALLAALDADAGVTDTNYASTLSV